MTPSAPMATRPSLPEPGETHDAGISELLHRTHQGVDQAMLPAAMRRAEGISLQSILQLLDVSGALTSNGDPHTEDEIIAALGAAPRHGWLVRRWLAALTGQNLLVRSGNHYQRLALPDTKDATTELAEAYAALGFPPAMAESHLTALEHLSRLIRDDISITQLLFQNGKIMESLAAYQDNAFTAYLNAACAYLLSRYVATCRGDNRVPLRVVELGGGAGLTTTAALKALQGTPTDYLFTDISRMFTQAAKARFHKQQGLRFGLLDINTDFPAQGLSPGSADVVIAGNVLHNATHVGQTLQRIRHLLAPAGWLIFTESTRDNHAILTSMQFLLSPPPDRPLLGSADRRAGTGQVFVDAAGWREELVAADFTPQFILPSVESPLAVAGQQLFFAVAN